MIVDWGEIFKELWDERSKKGLDRDEIEPLIVVNYISKKLTEYGKKGFRFLCLAEHESFPYTYIFLFEKTTNEHKYEYLPIPEMIQERTVVLENEGKALLPEHYQDILEKVGTSIYIPSLRYMRPTYGNAGRTLPVYFSVESKKMKQEKEEKKE